MSLSTKRLGREMRTIVVIGAGFCGAITAARLMREPSAVPIQVLLVNRSGLMARGVAYGTRTEHHVLNVPAGRMSAFAEHPDHFLNYAQSRDPAITAGCFVQRQLFGDYLESLLADAAREAGPDKQFRAIVGDVAEIEPSPNGSGARVVLDNGLAIDADRVVLALGNFAPDDAPVPRAAETFYRSPRYVRDPWQAEALWVVKPDQPVLLIGTGLTMLDVVLSLRNRGVTAPIHALSRRGLVPLSHRALDNPPQYKGALVQQLFETQGLSAALRLIRVEVERSAAEGVDWRDVVGSLRAATPALWARLSVAERRRFMRHVRAYWDVHRHRCAPELGEKLAQEQQLGSLTIHKGRLLGFDDGVDAVRASWRPRSSDQIQTLAFGTVINCTGPAGDTRRLREPLISRLRERGELLPDALGIGLEVNENYQLLNAERQPSETLYYVGPFLRAAHWEATAVPELRQHCTLLARCLVQSLNCAAENPAGAPLQSSASDDTAERVAA